MVLCVTISVQGHPSSWPTHFFATLILPVYAMMLASAALLASQRPPPFQSPSPSSMHVAIEGFQIRTRPRSPSVDARALARHSVAAAMAVLAACALHPYSLFPHLSGAYVLIVFAFSLVHGVLPIPALTLADRLAAWRNRQVVSLSGPLLRVDDRSMLLDDTLQTELDVQRQRLRVRTTSAALDIQAAPEELRWIEAHLHVAVRPGTDADVPLALETLRNARREAS